jgi:Ca2+-binding RTX toxin-like protein
MAIITGTSANNSLAGTTNQDVIYGLEGDDSLDGGEGADTLQGGAGDDTYLLDTPSDTVIEADSQGTDTVVAGFTYTLGLNFEKLILTGPYAINGTGNDLANTLTGNAAVNTLSGGLSNDTLYSGAGADTYVFTTGGGNNTLYNLDGETSGVANADVVKLAGVAKANVVLSRTPGTSDLVIGLKNPATGTVQDTLTIRDYCANAEYSGNDAKARSARSCSTTTRP